MGGTGITDVAGGKSVLDEFVWGKFVLSFMGKKVMDGSAVGVG
jgi:hypothetical protein